MSQRGLGLICEPASDWVLALRLAIPDAEAPLREARSLAAAWDLLEGQPDAVVFWSLAFPQPLQVLQRVFAQQRYFPDSVAVVLGQRHQAALRPLAREAGAVDVLCSPRELSRVSAWVRRRWADREPDPHAAHPLLASAWRLPW